MFMWGFTWLDGILGQCWDALGQPKIIYNKLYNNNKQAEMGIANMMTGWVPRGLRHTHMGAVWSLSRAHHRPICTNTFGASMDTAVNTKKGCGWRSSFTAAI